MTASLQDTIAAIATPLGEAGLGIIRLSGPSALAVVRPLFHSTPPIVWEHLPSPSVHIGSFADPDPIDQIVLTFFRAPRSYTGEDVVEISAHGSPYVLQQILQHCLHRGARLAQPGEFTLRAFLNGKMDLTQAEAVADLIHAKTEKTRAAAFSQLEGHLAQKVRALRDQLMPLLAHIEVGLDHSDEEHDFLPRERLVYTCQAVQEEIAALLASAQTGKVLREGLRVAIIGKPNVGKSSLLNAFLREERAIVTPVAGTTRDTLEEVLDCEGVPLLIVDTAGVREHAQDPVERLGIERTQRALQSADLVLCVLDGHAPLSAEDHLVIRQCLVKPHFWVINKSDLGLVWDSRDLSQWNGRAPCLPISARTGQGLQSLIEHIKRQALQQGATLAEAQWLLNVRHRDVLERAAESLRQALQAAQGDAYEECVALELKTALQALGEMIGEVTTEDLLDQIFSKFCIGK